MDIFSQRLKWLREKKGMTQKEVAEYMGVSQQYYGRFEKGNGQPNLEGLVKLRYLFNEPTEFLLGLYNFDTHAAALFSIYRNRKQQHERRQERLREFFEVMNKSLLDDEKLRSRLKRLIFEEDSKTNERIDYEKAKKLFIEYIITVPGINEQMINDEFIDKLNEYYDDEHIDFNAKYLELEKDLLTEDLANKKDSH